MKNNSNEVLGIGLPTHTSIEEVPLPIRFPSHLDGWLVEFSAMARLFSTKIPDGWLLKRKCMHIRIRYKLVGRLLVAIPTQ